MSESSRATVDEDLEIQRSEALARLVPEVTTALAAADDVHAWPPNWADVGEIDYFYRSRSVLTRSVDAPRVRVALAALGSYQDQDAESEPSNDGNARSSTPVEAHGVTQFEVQVRESQHTADLLKDLDDRVGTGVATHEHVFAVTGLMCPATEPERVISPQRAADPVLVDEALWPPRSPVQSAGQGVSVSIVDTGLIDGIAQWAPWLTDVVADTRADVEVPDRVSVDPSKPVPDGFADPYAGHGSFIAGVVRCLAPATSVTVEKLINRSGLVSEMSMITQIRQTLARSPGIISMSAGGYTRGNIPPMAIQALWRDRMSQVDGTTFVAAAGNDGVSRPFWPAAFPWCVAVGSMSRDGQRRSWFSNYGPWVNVYAPGEGIVNAYPRLKYQTIVNGDIRDTSAGIVKWSGTSFATPIVAGLIAARMSRTGESSAEAGASLLSAAQGQFRPDIGPRLFP